MALETFIEPMGYKPPISTSFYAVMIGYLTNYAIPRGGELARCGVMFGTDKIPVDKLLGMLPNGSSTYYCSSLFL